MHEEKKKKFDYLKSLLTGWGIKESWAKVIAGAIIGAICGFMMSSCSWDLKASTSDQVFESSVEVRPLDIEK